MWDLMHTPEKVLFDRSRLMDSAFTSALLVPWAAAWHISWDITPKPGGLRCVSEMLVPSTKRLLPSFRNLTGLSNCFCCCCECSDRRLWRRCRSRELLEILGLWPTFFCRPRPPWRALPYHSLQCIARHALPRLPSGFLLCPAPLECCRS